MINIKKIFVILVSFFSFINISFALNKAPVDITNMSIEELQDAMDKGYLTSELLVNLYMDRINEYDNMFNSINQINYNALEQAKLLDEERANGKVRSSLHGIPILVKTNIDVVGLATTGGTKSLSDNYPNDDAYVIQKLIDAGAIILASTNMSELAFSSKNSYSSYGYVRNVFNTDFTSYGSSGGSAVGLGASFGAAALGTDTNSSVRMPAAAAGVVGYRPTLGLISRDGVIPYDIERDTVGIMTKNVSDNALILSIISGEDINDSYTYGFDKYENKKFDVDYSNYTIGVITQYLIGVSNNGSGGTQYTDTDIYSLADESIKKLINAGANVVYLDEFFLYKNYSIATSTYAGITMCDNFNDYIVDHNSSITNFKQLANSSGHVQRLSGYVKGCGNKYKSKSVRDKKKLTFREYVDNYFKENNIDVIAYPTLKDKPFKYNGTGSDNPGSFISSVIGYPSITVPIGNDNMGFSYGLEFMALGNEDYKLLNIAYLFEQANENNITTSLLVPSLYEIPDIVSTLIDIYESNNLDSSLKEEIYNYFINYNNNDNYLIDAEMLIGKYNSVVKESNFKLPKEKKVFNYDCLLLLSTFIIILIFNIYNRIKHS